MVAANPPRQPAFYSGRPDTSWHLASAASCWPAPSVGICQPLPGVGRRPARLGTGMSRTSRSLLCDSGPRPGGLAALPAWRRNHAVRPSSIPSRALGRALGRAPCGSGPRIASQQAESGLHVYRPSRPCGPILLPTLYVPRVAFLAPRPGGPEHPDKSVTPRRTRTYEDLGGRPSAGSAARQGLTCNKEEQHTRQIGGGKFEPFRGTMALGGHPYLQPVALDRANTHPHPFRGENNTVRTRQ